MLCVVGARPNLMKMAPILKALGGYPDLFQPVLIHTGQHYDRNMNGQFFDDLRLPEADLNLGVGSASHVVQTAEIMMRFEPVVEADKPNAVLVVGDVNSTLACALVAAKKNVPVIHVEAGLRSFDKSMPEEINRVLTDQISDLLFTTEPSGRENLLREGVSLTKIHFVGNVMIDTLHECLNRSIPANETLLSVGANQDILNDSKDYALLTLHRPSNVDNPVTLRLLLEAIQKISVQIPLVFPMHPRTQLKIAQFSFQSYLKHSRIIVTEALGYLQILGLIKSARLVLTDSGGIQEETTALGVPCVTLRNSTERPITVEQGTNTVVGLIPDLLYSTVSDILSTGGKHGRIPELWDGKSSARIANILRDWHIANS